MRDSNDGSNNPASAAMARVFEQLAGNLLAVDQWTRVDIASMDEGSRRRQDAVAYRGLTAQYRVAGLTLGDADAAPFCAPFLIEIADQRLRAQAFWAVDNASATRAVRLDAQSLKNWAAGSLTKDLRVMRFGDGDIGLEAELHLSPRVTQEAIREFATAFSWDVASFHAGQGDGDLLSTDTWVRRAALSISRSTPQIPLRSVGEPAWESFVTPDGVFCSLQPSGGLCASDNVLYAVRRDASVLEPMATMPGHRSDWDCYRFTDVWLARDGATALARTLLCEGLVTSGRDGLWHPVESDPITAVAPWGDSGFLLGLHDARVAIVDGSQRASRRVRLCKAVGRFSRLAAVADRAVGVIGTTLVGARLAGTDSVRPYAADMWTLSLDDLISTDVVAQIDLDSWASEPAVALLGDGGIVILDAMSGAVRSQYALSGGQQIKWIGPGWLLVLDALPSAASAETRLRVLDVVSGRWTEPVHTGEIARIAVRGDEIHVGYTKQSIAIWDRAEVCRRVGVGGAGMSSHPDAATGAPVRGPSTPTVVDMPGRSARTES